MKWRKVVAHPLFKLAVASAILAGLYWAADWRAVGRAIVGLDGRLLVAALVLFIPQTLVSARRWQILVRPICDISLGEAIHQTLLAAVANLVIPSKLGDATKAGMVGGAIGPVTCCLVFEKVGDVAALAVFLLVGGLGWQAPGPWISVAVLAGALVLMRFWPNSLAQRASVAMAYSLLLWVLHLAQIDLFLQAAGVVVPWPTVLARVPVAIFAGLLPITLWGVGTRDSVLIWMFSDVASASTMAVVGLLTALRYLVPGVAGLAWMAWSAFRDWRRTHCAPTWWFDARGRAHEARVLSPEIDAFMVPEILDALAEKKSQSRLPRRHSALPRIPRVLLTNRLRKS
ncbi:MAG: lysylphosphatidylglycerol synthase transmembrane domain-containing protein [Pirellulales bacterium]